MERADGQQKKDEGNPKSESRWRSCRDLQFPQPVGRILIPPPPETDNSLSPRRRSGERARERGRERTSQPRKRTPLPNPLPTRASRGEGVANAVSWWRYQDAPRRT